MEKSMDELLEIRALLQAFQEGYTRRDLAQVDAFMDLFTEDAEVIGTNGTQPGAGEWYTSRAAARELVHDDWAGWGDLRLDVAQASIHARGDTGWLAASATVTQTIGADNYAQYLKFVKEYIETSPLPAEQKLHYILRGGTNTLYELRRGEIFVWPLRFTAVVVRETGQWKFAQMNFSFPTMYFPDVRLVD
jgi:ketosteroid isomerase-like protein